MKTRLSESLQVLAAFLITGSLIITFEPHQDVKAIEPEHLAVQTVESTVKAPETPVEAPQTPEIQKVEEVPVQTQTAVTAPQKAPQTVSEPAPPAPAPNNEQIIWNYLTWQGFNAMHTAAIMGNLKQEHNFNTDGDGIAQWTGARKANLMNDPNWQDINVQLKFLVRELKGTHIYVYNELKASTSLEAAVRIFQNKFEVCDPQYCMEAKRIQYAREILARH